MRKIFYLLLFEPRPIVRILCSNVTSIRLCMAPPFLMALLVIAHKRYLRQDCLFANLDKSAVWRHRHAARLLGNFKNSPQRSFKLIWSPRVLFRKFTTIPCNYPEFIESFPSKISERCNYVRCCYNLHWITNQLFAA